MDREAATGGAGFSRDVRQLLERANKLRAAVGIAAVVERVHADEDVERADHLGESEREGKQHRYAFELRADTEAETP